MFVYKNGKGNNKGNKRRINSFLPCKGHLLYQKNAPGKRLKVGGYLLSLKLGAHVCNESCNESFKQLSDGIRHPGSSHLSALPSSAGWLVLLGWRLLGPTWLPHFQESHSRNTQRKKRAVSLPFFVKTKKCFPEAESRLF